MPRWETIKLGDAVSDVSTGPFGSVLHEKDYVAGGIPLVNPINMVDGAIVPDWSKTVAPATLERLSSYILHEGDLVVARRGDIGRCAVVRRESSGWLCGTGSFFIRPSKRVAADFLAYLLSSPDCRTKLVNAATGTTMLNLSNSALKDLLIPLPPLDEQKRIVAILDEAFEGLDRAAANAKKNLANARELFDSHLNAIVTQPGPDWVDALLEDACEKITVGHVGSMASKYVEDGIPFLRSQNVRPFRVDYDGMKFIDASFNSVLRKSELRPGDVAIVRTGYPGTAAVIPESLQLSNCADLVIASTKAFLNPYFLAMFLNSAYGRQVVLGNLTGAAQKHFNINAARQVRMPLPSRIVQETLVASVQSHHESAQELDGFYKRKLQALSDLKQSILQKAFAGELPERMDLAA